MRLILPLLGLLACAGPDDKSKAPESEAPTEVTLTEVCAAPEVSAAPGWGDANHDGVVDLSDGLWTTRALMHAGPAPACEAAMDLVNDDLVDVGDALLVYYHLYTANMALPGRTPSCDTVLDLTDPACGRFALALDAPASVSAAAGATATAEVHVTLQSPDLAVQGWSFGVHAEGCTISAATEAGTAGADANTDAAGKRNTGFLRMDLVSDGLVHATVLSWQHEVALPLQDDAWRLLTLTVSGAAPTSGCTPCTLGLTGELAGDGQPVQVVVAAGGWSYHPPVTDVTVDVCAG